MDLKFQTENELQNSLETYFSRWFTVEQEVKSDCGNFRIDLLMTHRDAQYNSFQFGIEVKEPEDKKTGSEIGAWVKQAANYACLTFKGKKTIIFIAPQLSGYYLQEGTYMSQHKLFTPDLGHHYNVNSFLYSIARIGEVQKYCYEFGKYKGTHFRLVINVQDIWCSTHPYRIKTHLIKDRCPGLL